MKIFLNKISYKIILFFIIILALFFRLYGLNWDQGQHLHPDERFLTMVASAIIIPSSFTDYLNPQISTMSPYNNNYSFFVYGTFPLYLTKVAGVITGNDGYGNIHFIGRILSALFDIGTVFLLFKIGQKILNVKAGLLAAFLYSIMVLPIQLSHFFAVDTFLNFFLISSFYFLVLFSSKSFFRPSLFLGISFGLALACKISALYFLPIVGFGYLYSFINEKNKKFVIASFLLFVICFLSFFRLAQPTAFSSGNFLNWQPSPQFVANLKELKNMSGSDSWYPPAVQWHSTKPILFPLKNMVLWGMGLPLGIIAVISLIYSLISLITPISLKSPKSLKSFVLLLIIVWVLGLFTYLGLQFCKSIRYFLPIYPFLALLSANLLSKLNIKFMIFIIFIIFIYPLSFLSIYSRPITRVTASKWIYENIPNNAVVTFEEWDDGLPLSLPNYPYNPYKTESLFMYDFDTPEKWQKLNEKLARVDYIFLTSNRAYGSILKLPGKYPQSSFYYQSLFRDTGEFQKVAEFTSRPCFPPFGDRHLFCFNDDNAEEAFTVYDHPKVIIFKKIPYQNHSPNKELLPLWDYSK